MSYDPAPSTSPNLGEKDQVDPDAHGQAALLLVESLLHGLIGKGILSNNDAMVIAASAAEVKEEITHDNGEPAKTAMHSLQIIDRIITSLAVDQSRSAASHSNL